MRAQEFVSEARDGKISKRAQQPSRGINVYGDKERVSGDYTAFKLGQALAMTDGSGKPIDIDAKSWHGKKKTAHPYTQVEQDMLNDAYKAVGASPENINKGDMRSMELDSTHTVSPVANWMKK